MAGQSLFSSVPQFATFQQLVKQNIGYFPELSYDQRGSRHRARIFKNPAAVEIVYSERAVARHIELSDVVYLAYQRHKPQLLAGGLFLIVGGEFLRTDRFSGLALIARGFREAAFQKLRHEEIIGRARTSASSGNVLSLVHLFLPLAHEIGHLPEAQGLCPQAVFSDELLETYRLNFDQIRSFTADFDWRSMMADPRSPLHLSLLREEIASDFFAVSALFWLVYRSLAPGDEFPFAALATGLFGSPLMNALEAICLQYPNSKDHIRATTLAMHCRYSLIIDFIRPWVQQAFVANKNGSAQTEADVNELVDERVAYYDKLYRFVWDAYLIYAQEQPQIALLDQKGTLSFVGSALAHVQQRLAMAEYLNLLSEEVHGYSISPGNQRSLADYAMRLTTFDKIIVEGKKVLAFG